MKEKDKNGLSEISVSSTVTAGEDISFCEIFLLLLSFFVIDLGGILIAISHVILIFILYYFAFIFYFLNPRVNILRPYL